jgi:glycosyltransferase involved in cell wall biosynthesis
MAGTDRAIVIIPCFNEEHRLDEAKVEELIAAPDVNLVLVDDGSTDATPALLDKLESRHAGQIEVLHLLENVGKSEAVREGLLHAYNSGAPVIGYLDADFATPPHEYLRLLAELRREPEIQALLGARVALLGRRIVRSRVRHYLGRVFATVSSLVLGLRVYDTQCGAKVFRSSPELAASLDRPFRSRWVFDVELLARLAQEMRRSGRALGERTFVEVPLREWRDVSGSKLGITMAMRAFVDLLYLGVTTRLSRRSKC